MNINLNLTKIEIWLLDHIPLHLSLHIIAGAIIFALTHRLGSLPAMAIVLAIGVTKEVYDYLHPGHDASWNGVACTVLGGAIGLACTL